MDVPPLTLDILELSPPACLPPHQTQAAAPPLTPVPPSSTVIELPPLPANFTISPSPHYPAPFGTMSLGETFRVRTRLSNTSKDVVLGVKMMIEMQGPNGRFRLGEVVHQDGKAEGTEEGEDKGAVSPEDPATEDKATGEEQNEPEMAIGEGVEMGVSAEMKDVGVNLLICSVAWETPAGRKTFQRFFKFNVTPPLAIKTRVHYPSSPSVLLDPVRRGDIHLEVLVQNTSMAGLEFEKVALEPVKGLVSNPVTPSALASGSGSETLFPDDTRQYLFTLSPSPSPSTGVESSVFPPTYAPGTILPLGRLDVAWFSAPYRSPGRLQTSTLNRRVPAAPTRPIMPTRTSTAMPPTPGAGPAVSHQSPARSTKTLPDDAGWEYDLVLTHVERQVELERQFEIILRLAARRRTSADTDDAPAPAPRLGLQYLSHLAAPDSSPTQSSRGGITVSPPSRSSTPVGAPSFSPPTAGPSRPMTPVSSQLRQATSSTIGRFQSTIPGPVDVASPSELPPAVPFPPAPTLPTATSRGQVTYLGCSLAPLPVTSCSQVPENIGTTYTEQSDDPPRHWQVVHEHTLRFIALDEGMCNLGGIRVLELDDEHGLQGSVAREWDTLGDVWVTF